MREWLSWWSTTLPRSGPRVRVPSRALLFMAGNLDLQVFLLFYCNVKVDYIRNKKSPVKLDFLLMPAMGLEPIRCCHRQILSLVRLPFRHAGLFRFQTTRTKDILPYHVINCKQFYFNICWFLMPVLSDFLTTQILLHSNSDIHQFSMT